MIELVSLEEIPSLEAKVEELKDEQKKDDSKLELKILPSHLKYVFLEEYGHKPEIISNLFSKKEKKKFIQVLKESQKEMVLALSDLKGISLAYCIHKIKME